MKMGFGKHKGKDIEEVPASYLLWMLENLKGLSPAYLAKLQQEVERRENAPDPSLFPFWVQGRETPGLTLVSQFDADNPQDSPDDGSCVKQIPGERYSVPGSRPYYF